MVYHQSSQAEKTKRITVLDNIEDNFNYGAMAFPASPEDIQQFEEYNEITINIFGMSGETDIITVQDGKVEYSRNDMVTLSLVEEGKQGHFIYSKKLDHLMNTSTHTGYKDRRYCPYCRTGVWCRDETFEDHLMKNTTQPKTTAT